MYGFMFLLKTGLKLKDLFDIFLIFVSLLSALHASKTIREAKKFYREELTASFLGSDYAKSRHYQIYVDHATRCELWVNFITVILVMNSLWFSYKLLRGFYA